jgi:glucokinase
MIGMDKYTMKIFNEKLLKENYSSYVLGVDIGGTNTNLCVSGVKNLKPTLLFSFNFQTIGLDSIVPPVKLILEYAKNEYEIEVDFACIGAAGVVSPNNDHAFLTNAKWEISSKEIIDTTCLKSVFIINDFQAIGYAVNLLDNNDKKQIIQVRPGQDKSHNSKGTKVIIGPGTGLGKCILIYDDYSNVYIPISSEGGNTDFPIHNDFEKNLVDFVKKLRGISQPLTYEELISGRGIEAIYLFLRQSNQFSVSNFTKEIDNAADKTPLISKHRANDETCKETLRLFSIFFARCAKNYVLDTMARGGLYIAGGIAVKNNEIFLTQQFISEFNNAYRYIDFLKTVPIHIITDYDVSLLGSCYAAIYNFFIKKESSI